MKKSLVTGLFTFSVISGSLLFASPASAGNIWLTGHDADFHCTGGQQCNHFGIALDFVRQAAPDKTKPILVLDEGTEVTSAAGQTLAKAKNTVEGAGNPFSLTVVKPSSAAFASLALTTSAFSAIVIASDENCGGCDNTPASIAAINARTAAITLFFNSGGGLAYFAGAEDPGYYGSVPIPATAIAVSAPFTLTADGVAIGLIGGSGGTSDTNCCPTHNSFALPGAGSPLKVAETDSKGFAETLFAGNVSIGGGGFVPPPTGDGASVPPPTGAVPEPATIGLFMTGLGGLFLLRRKA